MKGLPFQNTNEDIKSYSGFIPIRPISNNDTAQMFFWYFPAQEPLVPNAPLVIWLQGGPGSSSMIGLFYENGPLQFINNELFLRQESWNKHYNMLFVDNPVGTGFSFVNQIKQKQLKFSNDLNFPDPNEYSYQDCPSPEIEEPEYRDGYCGNQAAVASDMIVFLDQFYHLFPELLESDLYLTGESYAGKYVPAIAYHIDRENINRITANNKIIFPLKGLAIGNGLVDPITQIKYHSTLALSVGLVGTQDANLMDKYANLASHYICSKEWIKSEEARIDLFQIFQRASGSTNYYDFRLKNIAYDRGAMNSFLNSNQVKSALHIPNNVNYSSDILVGRNLRDDVMKSSAWYLPKLLTKYTVLLYYGQFDFRDGGFGSTEWINNIPWRFNKEFLEANRTVWMVNDDLAGYVQEYQNLKRVDVVGCGHLCPQEQPLNTRKMLEKFLVSL